MKHVHIRNSCAADDVLCAEIANAVLPALDALRDGGEGKLTCFELRSSRLRKPPGHYRFLAEVETSPAGFADFSQDSGLLTTIFVLPLWQRCRVGSALLAAVENSVWQDPHAWVLRTNVRARRFFEGHGFQENPFSEGLELRDPKQWLLFVKERGFTPSLP